MINDKKTQFFTSGKTVTPLYDKEEHRPPRQPVTPWLQIVNKSGGRNSALNNTSNHELQKIFSSIVTESHPYTPFCILHLLTIPSKKRLYSTMNNLIKKQQTLFSQHKRELKLTNTAQNPPDEALGINTI